jgi:hypothetical protein
MVSLPNSASAKDRATAKRIVTSLRRDEEGGVVISDAWKLSLLPSPGATSGREQAFTDAIRHHDLLLAKSVLAQVLNLGEGPKGSFALGVTMSDLLTMAQEAQADYIADCISDYALRQFTAINFPQARPPRLQHGDIRKKDSRAVSIILSALVNAGLLKVDASILSFVRKFFGLPDAEATRVALSDDSPLSLPPSYALPLAPSADDREESAAALPEVDYADVR